MNWEEIREKCPKAYKKVHLWLCNKCFDDPSNNRNLYDFFDENEILVEITCGYNAETKHYWTAGIFSNTMDRLGKRFNRYPTRKEAETAAFTKAFEILEDNER